MRTHLITFYQSEVVSNLTFCQKGKTPKIQFYGSHICARVRIKYFDSIYLLIRTNTRKMGIDIARPFAVVMFLPIPDARARSFVPILQETPGLPIGTDIRISAEIPILPGIPPHPNCVIFIDI